MGRIQCVIYLEGGDVGIQDAISRTDCSVKTTDRQQGINLENWSYLFADWNRGQAEKQNEPD
ncbi:MAG: hypothetical protein ACLRR3_01560 [Eubacterium sp.]